MLRKAFNLAAVLFLFSALLVGCGGPGPEKAAQSALEATVSGDFKTASDNFCKKMLDEMPPQELIDEIAKELKQYEFDFSGLKYEVVEEKGDSATVHVSGTIKAKGPDDEKTDDMDEKISMVKEDGQWKVCE
ncbi:Rv0361 family membrane protein [Paucidesulfovibrio longus]|uniref:Rv0361 family membrane protein n=1 Tax=Paucidesulfovibrio longus TaxID=889 RepID=UPI0003B72789|nr:DUF4878 domain-containing protein [Paucidesulfovibrio longus]